MVKHAGGIVENQAIKLAFADDDLKGVAQSVVCRDEVCDDEAEGAPGELFEIIRFMLCRYGDGYGEGSGWANYCGNSLHAENKGVRSEIA
jgi:hypothetical protein